MFPCLVFRLKMKKEYILAMFLLIGLGTVSTMAFTVNTEAATLGLYEVDDSGTEVIGITGSSGTIKAFGKNLIEYSWTWTNSGAAVDATAYLMFTTASGFEDLGPSNIDGGVSFKVEGGSWVDVSAEADGDTVLQMDLDLIAASDSFQVRINGADVATTNTGIFISIEEGTTVGADAGITIAESEL